MESFGKVFQKILEDGNLSQSECSRLSGVSRTMVLRMCSGERLPSRDTLERVIVGLRLQGDQRAALYAALTEERTQGLYAPGCDVILTRWNAWLDAMPAESYVVARQFLETSLRAVEIRFGHGEGGEAQARRAAGLLQDLVTDV